MSALACGKNDPAPASAAPAEKPQGIAQEGNTRAGAPGAGRGGPGAGRGMSSITLAASDVAVVTKGSVEEGVSIAGDLKPIESVDVRARLEGDLVGVYVREGQRVTEGQVLARFESSEEESGQRSAEADRASAQTDLATAQWNYDQSQELFKAGAISEQNLKVAQQAVAAARARLAATEARLKSTSSVVRDTRVIAPTTGVVAARMVENGEHVARGASMFTVVRSDVLELAASVPARQANAVKVGQAVHFVADGRAIEGRVARVSPTIDPSTRSVAVYTQIANPGGAIKGGTFATGRVVSRVIEGALKVPMGAVRQSQDDGHPYVYRIDGRVIDIAQLQLGVIDDRAGVAEVLSGLSNGDRVVVGNVGSLGRGMQVQVIGTEGGRAGSGAGGNGGRKRTDAGGSRPTGSR
jgi:membrane fusion protein, multidrug efflux system